tara:strand:+ start:21935 stop:29257 length:7323 start_codon:yes stop_codon:yes gene_type:complete
MADPFTPQELSRNLIDDLLEQADRDLDLERKRQESIITSEEPDKVLSGLSKVEKQIENEPVEVQQSVRQKAYRPGYFDLSRTKATMAIGKPKDEKPMSMEDWYVNYIEYEKKYPDAYKKALNELSPKLGTVKDPAKTTTMKGERWSYPEIMYGEEHLEVEARKLAKEQLAGEGLIKPEKTFLSAIKEIASDPKEIAKKLPWLGAGIEAQEALELFVAIKEVKNGTADKDDYRLLIEAQMEMEREKSVGSLIVDIFTQLPGYAIEFSTTAGTANAGKAFVKKTAREALNWILTKQGKKIIKEGAEKFALRAVQGAVGTTAGALARTVDPRMWPRIMANTSKQLLPDYEASVSLEDKIEIVSEEVKLFGDALSEGFMLTFTENLGEQFGDTFGFAGKELTKFVKANPKSVVSGVIKAIIRKNPKVPPGKIMQGVRQAGIHSVPVEIFEERVTDFLQSGIEGHEFKWPTPEEWLAEIVAIGAFAGGTGVIGSGLDKRTVKKQEKAKAKGLKAIETGQFRELSDQEITDFASSLTPEERMEVGIGEDGKFEIGSDLGKEVVRRNLDMDKFPETEKEIREANARLNIKEQQFEGTDFTGALINKIEESTNIKVEREFLDRTLADEAEEQGWTEAETKQVLKEHGLDENSDPSQIDLTGTSFGGSIKISTAGTPERMAQEYVAVQEEMAEEYYKAEQENNPNFDNEIEQERKAYHESTGEQDTGESDIEWFSTKAVHFATQGKVHESIGAKLRDIFKRFIDTSKQILKDAIKLRRAIKEGKVPESLVSKLKEATDFKTVGKKVNQADTSKEKTSYRISKKQGSDLVWENIPLKKQPNLLELTKYFTSKAKEASEKLGVDLTENTPEALDIISNVIAEEINIETGNEQNALGWYSAKMQNAIELLGQIHPDLISNDNHNQVFKIALAITSNGAPVEDNLKNAVSAYEYWRDNNSLPTNFKQGGKEAPAMVKAFQLYNKLVSDIGIDAVHTLINTQLTVKEITDRGYPVNGELVTEKVMGAVIFGPKVGGGFLSNLNGHYEYLTMDRWFMRTMGRIRGNLKDNKDYTNQLKRFRTALRINPTKMKKYGISKEQLSDDEAVIEVARKVLKDYAKKKLIKKDNKYRTFYPKTKLNKSSNTLVKVIDSIHEAPGNGTERKYLREIMKKAVEKSNIDGLTMADAQAIIWFPEKRIFSNFGVGSQRGKKETDYEIEARKYVEQRLGRVEPIGRSTARKRTTQRDSAKDQQDDQNLGNREKTNQEVKPSYRITESSYKLDSLDSFELFETAKKIFGTTENSKEAGYILPDGTMLDFSGKNEGGTPGKRAFDHRQINEVSYELPQNIVKKLQKNNVDGIGMEEFIYHGAIRWMPEAGSFNLMNKPDPQQLSIMRKLTDDNYGEVIVEAQEGMKPISRFDGQGLYREYDIHTSFETIKRDINQFYTTGRQPSITQQFRGSYRLTQKNIVTPLAKVYQEQKGNKKSYTKKDWEQDLARLGYDEDMIKSAMDMFGIIRMKQIDTTDPTPIEKELKKLQEREIKKSEVKNRIKRAYRLGATEKEKEITKLQKIVTNYARENLPTGLYQQSEVTGILAKVRDAKRFRELRTAMERIDRVIDKVSKRSALAKFNKTIKKKATIKKVGGIGRGKVGAEVQDIVNKVRAIYKKPLADIENEIEVLTKIIDANQDGEPTDEQSIDINILLQYGDIKSKTPQQIAEATESLDVLITQGRIQIMDEQMAYAERMSAVRQEILDVITGGAGSQTQAGAQKLGLKDQGIIKEIVESLSGFETQQQSLEYLFDKLSRLDKTSKPLQSFINNYFMPQIRQARLAEYNGVVEMHKLMKENAERIFKVKDTTFNKALTKLFNRNSIETITITHRDGVEGEMTSSDLTYNQAYKKWMELKDPTLYKTFEKMGWDIQKTKNQIEQQLPKEVIAWAEWQLYEFYPMYYQRVNETFRNRFFVNMPMNPMYSPIARRIGAKADEGDDTLNKSKSPMGSMSSAGSLKGRVSNTEELAWIDGDSTLMKHVTEMEHFIHYTNIMRELRSVFMSRDVSRSIQDFHGKNISRTLNKFMDDIARGGVDRAMHLEWADKWRANVTRATIGLNEVVFIKQLTSIPAYWGDMPIISWQKEVLMSIGSFEFKKAYRTLSKSDMIKMRYDKGFERDMVLALNNIKPGKMMTGSDWLNNVAFFLTKMGDKTAIFLGGWPLYKYEYKKALKEGKTKKEAEDIAMKKFEASTLRAQQASDVEDLSDFQRAGSAWKFFTMYMTSPNQYYRMSAGGVRNIYYGRGTKAENLRRIFVGWFLLPQLFTFVANGFEIDEDEQLISLFTGPFIGLMFVGQGIEHSIRMAFGKEYRSGSVALLDVFNDFGRMFKKMFNGKEFDTKKILSIIDDFLKGSSKAPLVGGFPYAPVKRSIASKMKVIKGESDNPIREAVGFKFKNKLKKKKKSKKQRQKVSF